jgi:hypothetical protein
MTELLSDLNEHTKETLKIKKEKAAKREANEKKAESIVLEVKEKPKNILFEQPPPTPAQTIIHPSFPSIPTPTNPNIHRKSNTRW